MKAMIIPGNGNTDIKEIWFPYVKSAIESLGIEVIAENMPDPELAREKFWVPFVEKKIDGDEAILIGHSSGAVAVMRYLERNKAKLAILIGACYTDLGDEDESKSGYYNHAWDWEAIKRNTEKIVLFASQNDPYIPISEPRFIKEKLNPEYHEYLNQGHFGGDVEKTEFPEIVTVVKDFISD